MRRLTPIGLFFAALALLFAPSTGVAQVCGNGVVEDGESCDGADWEAQCGDERYYRCLDCHCDTATCGDGDIDTGEACDNGPDMSDTEPDACRPNCRLPHCGDGVIDSGEQCDDGNDVDGDGCDFPCTLTGCGNGVRTGGEECDDGNRVNGDGCDHNCTTTRCGNGVRTSGETCDDGNTSNEDDCLTLCLIDQPCCVPNTCGDGFVNRTPGPSGPVLLRTEACDDGNTDPIGGADTCGYACQQDFTVCGNSVLDQGETCDLGLFLNSDEPDALCRPTCQVAGCGDGIVDSGEECDRDEGCGADCTWLAR